MSRADEIQIGVRCAVCEGKFEVCDWVGYGPGGWVHLDGCPTEDGTS